MVRWKGLPFTRRHAWNFD